MTQPVLFSDAASWRLWLDEHEHEPDGLWLLLAKKNADAPTSLTYAQALEEALCSGWIDGQKRAHDTAMFMQRFTPRRSRSIWSQRNVGIVAQLIEQGRMRERGLAEIERARADGRWDRAYAGSAAAEVPGDLKAALSASPVAAARFEQLTAGERYPMLLQLMTATPAQRTRRIDRIVEKLDKESQLKT